MNLLDTIQRECARVLARARGIARRGTLGTGAGSSYTAQLKGHPGETWEGAELWQHFGFASRPPAAAEVAILELDGAGEGAVVVAEQDRAHRPAIAEGEVVLYGEKSTGQALVTLRPSGEVVIHAGGIAGGTITLSPTGAITVVPGGVGLVVVGGAASVEMLAKGTTMVADMLILATGIQTAFEVWSASGKALGDVDVWIASVSLVFSLWAAKSATWLATKAAVV